MTWRLTFKISPKTSRYVLTTCQISPKSLLISPNSRGVLVHTCRRFRISVYKVEESCVHNIRRLQHRREKNRRFVRGVIFWTRVRAAINASHAKPNFFGRACIWRRECETVKYLWGFIHWSSQPSLNVCDKFWVRIQFVHWSLSATSEPSLSICE